MDKAMREKRGGQCLNRVVFGFKSMRLGKLTVFSCLHKIATYKKNGKQVYVFKVKLI